VLAAAVELSTTSSALSSFVNFETRRCFIKLGNSISQSAQTSLTSRVQSGVIWNAISVSSTYLAGLVRLVVVARLLAPEDFGLIGMALTVVGGLSALTTIGLDISVIKTKFNSDEELSTHLDTIWTVDLARRSILALFLALLAYPAARFYREERLYQILLLFSLLPYIQGLQNIGLLIYRKKINFRRIVWLELATTFLTAATTIALVVWTRNVWALALSQLAAAVIAVLLSYRLHPYRPRLSLDRDALALALTFGKYALLMGVLGYVMQMADNILLGKLYSAAVLGTYVIAYNLAVLPLHGIATAIVNVTFPAYAEISGGTSTVREAPYGEMTTVQECLPVTEHLRRGLPPPLANGAGSQRLERAFVRVFATSSTLLALTTALLLLLGEEIVVFLYGPKWAAAGTILRVLAVLVFCKGHAILVSPLVISMRGLAPDAKIKLFEAAIFLALLYPLTSRFGALGAAGAGAIAFFITMINRLRVASSLLPNISKTLIRTVLSSVVACALGTALSAFAILLVKSVIGRLLIGGSVIALVVTGVMLVLSPQVRAESSRLFFWFNARYGSNQGKPTLPT
jgi:O-antigen/teichoic acid export membrane protein